MTTTSLISCVLCFYNEEAFLEKTVRSLLAQIGVNFEILLIDNASDDASVEIARKLATSDYGVRIRLLSEPRKGKINALQVGCAAADGAIVATIDADTIYPTDYLMKAQAMLSDRGAVAALAFPMYEGRSALPAWMRLQSLAMPRKCHTGGFGQVFQREALEQAGGFSIERWPYVLEDHEIMHRMAQIGKIAYRIDHRCSPEARRGKAAQRSWTLFDRLLYKALPSFAMDWFYYQYLASKLAARNLSNQRLRDRDW